MAPTPAPEAKPQGTGSSGRHRPPGRLTGPGPDTARPHDYRSPKNGAYGSPRPHQRPQRARCHLRPHQGRHTTSHTRATPLRRRPLGVPGASPPQSGPARTGTDPGPGKNQYHAYWQRGVPLYHKTSVTVDAHPNLGVDGRVGAYECVGPRWQLNVLLTQVPFGEETKDFLDALSLAYRRFLPPGTHHHHRRPKRGPNRRRPHRPTHSHRHSRPGRHAPTGPHQPHGRARRHTLPLPQPSRHPPLPHRQVLRGPNHRTRP